MFSGKRLPTFYQFEGNIKNLMLSVELSYVGTAFGNLPSYEQFASQSLPHSAVFDGSILRPQSLPSSHSTDDPRNVYNFENQLNCIGAIIDRRKIKWQEKIEKPTLESRRIQLAQKTELSEKDSQLLPSACDNRLILNENENNNDHDEHEKTKVEKSPKYQQEEEPKFSRIFTYVDSDSATLKQLNSFTNIKNDDGSLAFRSKRIAPLRPSVFANPVSFNVSEDQHRRNCSVSYLEQKMFIVAYVGNFGNNTEYNQLDEQTLCEVTLVNDRLLAFKPDLGTFSIKGRQGNYSVTVRVEPMIEFYSLINYPLTTAIDDDFGWKDNAEDTNCKYEFELPEGQTYWVHYLINIEQGINFPHDSIFLEYQIELPENVNIVQADIISGRTEACHAKEQDGMDIVQFSFPIEFTICYSTCTRKCNEVITWPRLLLRAISVDFWERFHVSGYSSINLPIQSGYHNVKANFWNVVNPYNYLSMFKAYFLGQDVDLKSIESAGNKGANNQWSKFCSKVGLYTACSGEVKLSINCVHQSRQYISRDVLRSIKYGHLMQRIGMSGSMHWRIMKVLNDFESAKQRLFQLRQLKIFAAKN